MPRSTEKVGLHLETTTRELTSETWVAYFDALTAVGDASLVAVEVVSDRPSDRSHAPRTLNAIGYDAADDVLHLDVGGRSGGDAVVLRHFIWEPQRIKVDGPGPFKPTAILVEDASGTRTQISFLNRPPSRPGGEAVGRPRSLRRPRRRSRCLTTESCG
jgi:hypothetical protein